MSEDEIYAEFERADVPLERLEHPAVHTVEESAAIHAALPAAHTKNLFLKDKQGKFWLVTLPSDRRADLKAFAQLLGAGKFSFGKPEDMERLLQIAPGSVTPLAAANAAGEVTVVLDAAFREAERIAVHPLRNTATIALPFDALETWLRAKGIPTKVTALP
ncbi:prolyl-tRNA synthetase associated domain-containing protein [Novosphingobium sp. BL-8A]|uniref:prolyl-tRNA synthetase associated domain-containing protein n=1 Tax=Novosphingobium sp. BL-8A TaxID=3127639 RepID=UPI0037574A93